jgi:large subunit ribosomal protein L5
MTPRLLERYRQEIIPKLQEELSLKNQHQIPVLTKIVVNMGLGEAAANPKLLDNAASELSLITGQKAVIR